MNAIKPRTDTDNAAANKRDALLMLTAMNGYGASRKLMLDELTFNFGYTPKQAQDVYQDWCKQVA